MVRARRIALGLTLEQVAALAGCTKSYLSGIENGRREAPPSESLLRKIEEALGFAEDELVRIAAWQTTPASVKRHVTQMQRRESATRKLLSVLSRASEPAEAEPRGNAAPGAAARSLDDLYQSGELKRLIDAIAPDEHPSGEHAGTFGTPSAAPAIKRATSAPPAPPGGVRGVAPLASMLPVEIPLINSVAAGYPAQFTDLDYPARVADEYVRAPDIHDPDAFAARVVGDSMLPDYREGDVVIFSPAKPIKSGMDCFARLEPDHETTFKRVYFETAPSGEKDALIRLQPLNPAFAPSTLPREQVAGLYAAVGVMRML